MSDDRAPGPTRTARDAVFATFGAYGVAVVPSDLADALALALDAARGEGWKAGREAAIRAASSSTKPETGR